MRHPYKLADLTRKGREGIPSRMKLKPLVFSFFAMLLAAGVASAQDTPPPLAPLPKVPTELDAPAAAAAPADVVLSATRAVEELGDAVVLGHYKVAVEKMNPQWKERTAKRIGGMEALEKQLDGVSQQMVQQGITIISFKPQGLPRSFEVTPGRKVEKVNGEEIESLVYNKWLVLIPTITQFRIVRPGQAKPTVIDSTGFQVAIADKGKNNWSFIDGAGLTVNELRGLFGTLPQDLQLPPIEKREAR
jgi:hypothetical protein